MDSFTSKMVEPVSLPDRGTRAEILEAAGYNLFNLDAADVFVDLLTDSGTGGMSEDQWAALMRGDEAYAGSRSFHELVDAVREVTGFEHVVPVHQGRGGENVLYGTLLSAGDYVPNNTHFDTTRAHVVNQGAEAVDCPIDAGLEPTGGPDFKGDMDPAKVRALADEVGAENIPVVISTITNNSMAGQPVSVANLRKTRDVADELDATFVIDACRFAENSAFVQAREAEFADATVAEIARDSLELADAILVSGKKDGLVNIGGFVACEDRELFEALKQRAIMYEGFPTYGGMAGRDMAAMAVGLREAVTEEYVHGRLGQLELLGELLDGAGVPIWQPPGGHAVYVDAGAAVPHLTPEQFPGQAFAVALYEEGGVRGVELGSFAFPDADRPEMVRLAVPRRKYHREHFAHVAETARAVMDRVDELPGYEVVGNPAVPELRHFSAELAPIE